MMNNNFYPMYPVNIAPFSFNDDPDLGAYFNNLPEETQRALLREDVHTTADLRRRLEEYQLKE